MVAPLDYHDSHVDRSNDLLYPFVENTISMKYLIVLATIPTVCSILLFQIKFRSLHDIHNGLLGLAESISLSQFFTEFGKKFAGRLRPHYYSRILFDPEGATLSYPSGHTSLCTAILIYLCFYFMGKFRVLHSGYVGFLLVSIVWAFLSFALAITRVRDYHHNFSDINAGFVIGTFSAISCYFLNYPSLKSNNCDLPKNRNDP